MNAIRATHRFIGPRLAGAVLAVLALCAATLAAAVPVTISMPVKDVAPGGTVDVPITASVAPTGLGIYSVDFRIRSIPRSCRARPCSTTACCSRGARRSCSRTTRSSLWPAQARRRSSRVHARRHAADRAAARRSARPEHAARVRALLVQRRHAGSIATGGVIRVRNGITGVDDPAGVSFALAPASPSPARFRPHGSRSRFRRPRARLAVYALDGRLVRELEKACSTRHARRDVGPARRRAGSRVPVGVFVRPRAARAWPAETSSSCGDVSPSVTGGAGFDPVPPVSSSVRLAQRPSSASSFFAASCSAPASATASQPRTAARAAMWRSSLGSVRHAVMRASDSARRDARSCAGSFGPAPPGAKPTRRGPSRRPRACARRSPRLRARDPRPCRTPTREVRLRRATATAPLPSERRRGHRRRHGSGHARRGRVVGRGRRGEALRLGLSRGRRRRRAGRRGLRFLEQLGHVEPRLGRRGAGGAQAAARCRSARSSRRCGERGRPAACCARGGGRWCGGAAGAADSAVSGARCAGALPMGVADCGFCTRTGPLEEVVGAESAGAGGRRASASATGSPAASVRLPARAAVVRRSTGAPRCGGLACARPAEATARRPRSKA